MCCIYLPHMASDAKIQSAVTGREDSCFWLFSPWSRVGHALRSIFMLWLVKIWEVSSCGKFMQRLESCLLWQLKLTEFCVNLWWFQLFFSTGCTKWNSAAIRSLLLFMASLFIGFLVEKYVACQCRKSDFGWHRFRFHLAWCVRGLVWSDTGLTWYLSGAASRMVSRSNYCIWYLFFVSNLMKSSVVYAGI